MFKWGCSQNLYVVHDTEYLATKYWHWADQFHLTLYYVKICSLSQIGWLMMPIETPKTVFIYRLTDSIWLIFLTFPFFRACFSRRAAWCLRVTKVYSAQSRSANITDKRVKTRLEVERDKPEYSEFGIFLLLNYKDPNYGLLLWTGYNFMWQTKKSARLIQTSPLLISVCLIQR